MKRPNEGKDKGKLEEKDTEEDGRCSPLCFVA
jgi:hypothetical protein